jgi:hypothetical protein
MTDTDAWRTIVALLLAHTRRDGAAVDPLLGQNEENIEPLFLALFGFARVLVEKVARAEDKTAEEWLQAFAIALASRS